ncbi:hypothetical protein SynRS9915_02846 [Synechococcus sp. RS9915]|nr:hypothetical protein SynRS9915_02846 [Synechococcus sp. RS9915]
MRQQSFVLTHAPALSTAEQAGTQHQRAPTPAFIDSISAKPIPRGDNRYQAKTERGG